MTAAFSFLHAGQAALALVLFDETGADDTGWDRDGTDSEVGDADRHHAPKRCDRVNIAVTDGQQRGHTPPDAAECIAENVRLSVVLDTIHAHAARQHQHHDDEHRGKTIEEMEEEQNIKIFLVLRDDLSVLPQKNMVLKLNDIVIIRIENEA